MSRNDDVLSLSASEQRALIARGELRPSELIEATLGRIEDRDGEINAVVTVSQTALDEARALDERLDRGEDPGPLCGLPVGIKDVTPVAGLRTTYGSTLYADETAVVDAEVVRRLREAGAIILGKTNTPEFATGGNTFNEVFGRTRNPWNLERSAGGSTGGGAAALASGMISIAEGTDLGGSLRIPASFCGIVGLRPSVGLVPTWPSEDLWDTLQVSGPMARTAEDVALALQAMAGPTPLWATAQPTEGRDFVDAVRAGLKPGAKLAWCRDVTGIGVDPAIEKICRDAVGEMRQVGAEVEEIELDFSSGRKAFLALRGLWMIGQQHHRLDRIEEMGENLAGNIRAGLKRTGEELGEAMQIRTQMWERMRMLFEEYDHLITPCMVIPPFDVEKNYPETIGGHKMKTYIDWVASTFVLSLTGLPVASVPCGLDEEGLPVGLQIVGRPRGEESVLAAARSVQEAHPIGLPST